MDSINSLISQTLHYIKYSYNKFSSNYEHGMLIISIDVDVGKESLGRINQGKNDRHIHTKISESKIGRIEENAIPIILDIFDRYNMPATFALRGQLVEVDDSIISSIKDSDAEHEIGSHGYSHRVFTSLSVEEAEDELTMTSRAMKVHKVYPKSFIFPKNRVNHLNLLEKYGYLCYRDLGGYLRDGMYITKIDNLYDVHPSMFIDKDTRSFFLDKILKIAIREKLPLHLWFHLWNFGTDTQDLEKNMLRVLEPLGKRVVEYRENNNFSVETMYSAVRNLKRI